MARRKAYGKLAAALVAAASLAAIAAVAWNPWLLVRGEFARQRIVAGLSQGFAQRLHHRHQSLLDHRAEQRVFASEVVMQ